MLLPSVHVSRETVSPVLTVHTDRSRRRRARLRRPDGLGRRAGPEPTCRVRRDAVRLVRAVSGDDVRRVSSGCTVRWWPANAGWSGSQRGCDGWTASGASVCRICRRNTDATVSIARQTRRAIHRWIHTHNQFEHVSQNGLRHGYNTICIHSTHRIQPLEETRHTEGRRYMVGWPNYRYRSDV